MRLIIRVPRVEWRQHRIVFDAAAKHVLNHYGVSPSRLDPSGSDVARASFVSWDWKAFINTAAIVLPVPTLGTTLHSSYCVKSALPVEKRLVDAVHWSIHHARESKATLPKPDGTAFTNKCLLELAKKIAFRTARDGQNVCEELVVNAARAWWTETTKDFELRTCLKNGSGPMFTPGGEVEFLSSRGRPKLPRSFRWFHSPELNGADA